MKRKRIQDLKDESKYLLLIIHILFTLLTLMNILKKEPYFNLFSINEVSSTLNNFNPIFYNLCQVLFKLNYSFLIIVFYKFYI
jgi:hypothetical protein